MAYQYKGLASSQLIFGNDALTQNLFVVQNGYASRVNIIIKCLAHQNDPQALLTSVMPQINVASGTGLATGGTELGKVPFSTAYVSDANVKILAAYGNCSPITIVANQRMWQQYSNRMHTAFGQVWSFDSGLIPTLMQENANQYVLRPGQVLVIQVTGATAASNAALCNNMFAQVCWEEEAISTFAISGTVTLGGVAVVGAKVTVIEADDESMTNARIVEVKTTGVGGLWASTIRNGCVGSAFVQYKDGSTYYTAPGSPYLE